MRILSDIFGMHKIMGMTFYQEGDMDEEDIAELGNEGMRMIILW